MVENEIDIDSYGYLTITRQTSYTSSAFDTVSRYSENFVYLTPASFGAHCRDNEDGTRTLMLNGDYLLKNIYRIFHSWDIGYLTIFLKKNHNVTKIDLSHNDIDSDGFKDLVKYLISSNHVLELDLSYNDIEEDESVFKYLQRHAEDLKLKVLSMSGNKIGYKMAKKLALMMQKNIYIERLEVANIDQNEDSLIYFIAILRVNREMGNKSLKALDLSRPIPKAPCYKFNSQHIAGVIGSMLRNNITLEELYLRKFHFSCHDIEEMFEDAKYNRTLKCLDFRCNNIGDHGMEILSKWLQQRPALRTLLLGHNIITNHGISALSRGIPFSEIKVLDLSHNRFNDEGCVELLHSIKKTPQVRQLQIFGNKIGHDTAKIIRRMLLSTVLNQDFIDVQVYEIDGTLQVAYRECQTFKERAKKSQCI